MYKHILVPTDGTELSDNAIRSAIALAKGLGARITGFYATEDYPVSPLADYTPAGTPSPEEFRKQQDGKAKGHLGMLARESEAAGVPCTVKFFPSPQPYKAIIQAAEENGCDLIVMASHGRSGVQALVLGSETHKVLTHSKIPVLVCR